MHALTRKLALLLSVAALAAPLAVAAPASANRHDGLVNVNIENILNGNQITVLQNVNVGVAAAFCNINVNVLSAQLQNNQFGNCPAKTTNFQKASVTWS